MLVNVTDVDKSRCDDAELVAAVDAELAALGDGGRVLLRPSGTEPLVRVMVDRTLPVAPVSIQATARTLAVHPRTLQRRLRAEGTSFAAIVDEVRRRNAHRYLTGTDLPLTRISTLLGFAEQATFTRSCRRWWVTTPTAVRRGRPGDGDGHHAALSATAP